MPKSKVKKKAPSPSLPADNKSRLITIRLYVEESGRSDPAIRSMIASGRLEQGVHYYRQGRSIMIDRSAMDLFWKGRRP
jgi:hypothetical protein